MAIVFGSDAGVYKDQNQSIWDRLRSTASEQINAFVSSSFSSIKKNKEAVHVDNGFNNVPGTAFLGSNVSALDDIKQRSIITQTPIATIYIKKRAFWSLKGENDIKYMDSSEKLFIRATKALFERKCEQIGTYELLLKAQRLLDEESEYDASLVAQMIEYLEEVIKKSVSSSMNEVNSFVVQAFENSDLSSEEIYAAVDQNLQKVKEDTDKLYMIIDGFRQMHDKIIKTSNEVKTTWVVNDSFSDIFSSGRGCGVIELTLISNISTDLGLDGSGSFSFSLEDPYNITKITNEDIEYALHSSAAELDKIMKSIDSGDVTSEQIANAFLGPQYYLNEARIKDQLLKDSRTQRGIPGINFEITQSESADKKVVGFTDDGSIEFTKADYNIAFFSRPVNQQLSSYENSLVGEIFDLLESYTTEIKKMNTQYKDLNSRSDVTYARSNLRKHYLGKSIIQPMDCVHIYIRSKKVDDQSVTGPISSALNKSAFVQAFANDFNVSEEFLLEEMKAFGLSEYEIPTNLYRAIRTSGALRNAGTHVFAGIVESVSENYSASRGAYTTSVSGQSNMKWLDMSRVNFSPSLDQTQGLLQDPLTPFDIDVDVATGLVKDAILFNEDNRVRKEEKTLRHNSGSYVGSVVDESENGNCVDDIVSADGDIFKKYRHAPGMVYRWKQGIIVATRNVNLQTTLSGKEENTDKLRRDMGLTVIPNPFSGLNGIDIVSILVTGFPHNYEAFFNITKQLGTYSNPESPARSYFNSFFDIMRTQNRVFGDFKPVKMVNENPMAVQERLNKQMSLRASSSQLSSLRSELARLQDQRNSFIAGGFASADSNENLIEENKRIINSLDVLIQGVKKQISAKEEDFNNQKKNAEEYGLRLFGNDLAFDFGEISDSKEEQISNNVAKLRLRNSLIQLRPQYECKFNLDNNLFIVGDEYDKDVDLQAYAISSLGSQEIDMWNSNYDNPRQKCEEIAKTIDFEFFCNNFGHIEFRPPRYNKVPLSLLLKMFILDARENKKLYPDFVRELFVSRKRSFEDQLAALDNEIEIENILLGGVGGASADDITKSLINSDTFYNVPEFNEQSDELLAQRLIIARKNLNKYVGGEELDINNKETTDSAVNEIAKLNDSSANVNIFSDRLYHVRKLSQLISKRQSISETYEKIKAMGTKYDSDLGSVKLDGKSQKQRFEILGQFENLIEDDYFDFLGPNSSKRFIINDEDIIQYDFTESGQNVFTNVKVNGQIDYTGDSPGQIGNIPVLFAGATDFDMWRQYGWRPHPEITRPFLKNAESQCAPYAMMLLSRARKNAVTGEVKLVGNEYYQLGDVVYVNSRDMLYYVSSIKHEFSYGENFSTRLSLTYGHALGEYIPTPLDVIGKMFIKNSKKFNKTVMTKETANEKIGVHLASVRFFDKKSDDEYAAMLSKPYGNNNLTELKLALSIAYEKILPDEKYPRIEIRGFITDEENKEKVTNRMKAVLRWFSNVDGLYDPDREMFSTLSYDFYVSKKLSSKNAVMLKEPILINDKKQLKRSDAIRLPKEEAFCSIGLDGKIDNIIEVVLITRDIDE